MTLDRFRTYLTELRKGEVELPNNNFDVGETTAPGMYRLSDVTCVQLLNKLAEKDFADTSPELRAQLLKFFSSSDVPAFGRLTEKERARLKSEVLRLENISAAPSVTKNEVSGTNPQ